MRQISRRDLLAGAAVAASGLVLPRPGLFAKDETKKAEMKIGLVTYLWGAKWNLDECLHNCSAAGVPGLELRTTHGHRVEPSLNKKQRAEVKQKFEDRGVVCLGPGSNERFDHREAGQLKKAIETTKGFLQLSHDIGGSGVKVKPNSFQRGVPKEKTIEQIGKALGELARFGDGLGQEVRLEVHGKIGQDFAALRSIMKIANHKRAVICWNSNDGETQGKGIEPRFQLVKDFMGQTAHVREMNIGEYPYQQLMDLFAGMNYTGWILLECRTKVKDGVKAMREQRNVWEKMVREAKRKLPE
ncbi:MAG: TIM barrel protein, partial [Planctomycetota bacterium]